MKIFLGGIVAAALGIAAWQGRTLGDLREHERTFPEAAGPSAPVARPLPHAASTLPNPAALLAEVQACFALPENTDTRLDAEDVLVRKLIALGGPEMRTMIELASQQSVEGRTRKEIEQRLGQWLEIFHPSVVLEDCAKHSSDLARFRLTAWAWARREPAAYLAWHESWRKEPEPEVPGYRLTALGPALFTRARRDPQSLTPAAFAGVDEIQDVPEMLGELAFSLPDHAGRLAVLQAATSHPDAARREQWVRAFAERLNWNVSFAGACRLAEESDLPPASAWTLRRTIAGNASDAPVAACYAWLASAAPAEREADWQEIAREWATARFSETTRLILSLPPSPRRDLLARGCLERIQSNELATSAWNDALARADAGRIIPQSHP